MAGTEAANIVVFADSDFFDDRFWVSEQNYLGQRFGVPIADNGKFLLNAVENMMGSSDLITLRGRERIARPFTRVEALRSSAEAQYLEEEENLVARIEAAQGELDRIERDGAQLAQPAPSPHELRGHRGELADRALDRRVARARRATASGDARLAARREACSATRRGAASEAVSYTHLTLPTKRIV